MAGRRRPMTAADIAAVEVVDELDVSADGRTAVVVQRVIRRRRKRSVYESQLWLVDLAGDATPRQLTTTSAARPARDTWPRWSPDGRHVAFIRSDPLDDESPDRLCVVAAADVVAGDRVHTLAPHGGDPGFGSLSSVEWSPDGTRLAFTAESGPPRLLVGEVPPLGQVRRRSSNPPAPVARRVVSADWRWDGTGHLDYWTHLFVIDVDVDRLTTPGDPAVPRQVTAGDFGVTEIAWHPAGRRVAFVSDRSPDRDRRPRPAIWAVDLADRAGGDATDRAAAAADPVCLLSGGLSAGRPAFSPDGRWLAAVGVLDPDALDDVSPGLLIAPADGTAPAVALSPELDRPIGNWTDTDMTGWMVAGRVGPAWLDRSTIVAVVTDRGRSLPARWMIDPATGAAIEQPAACERSAPGPWADAATQAVAVAAGSVWSLSTAAGRAVELSRVSFGDLAGRGAPASLEPLTSFGSAWQRRFIQPEMARIDVPGEGGPIETWVASPPGATGALPTVVSIHGGPLGGWAPAPHVETIVLVGAGYRVVCPNIRGSAGYGAGWVRPQLGDWGGVDVADVHAVVDHVVALGLADPARLGLFGLSYGGFVVNWMVGTSDRFRAAVSENGVTNQVSAWAGSDSGPEYCRMALLGDPLTPEGVERLWRQSPLRHVANVHTPLLLLQGEADLRCPASDNEQFFVALRQLGRTVEYVVYPESFHTFGYTGRPDRRIDRTQRVLDWFAHYLQP